MRNLPALPLIFACLTLSPPAFSHAGHHHGAAEPNGKTGAAPELQQKFEKINELYQRDVKPIFQRSCFDCHSQSPNLPWYHALPLVKGLLDSDIQAARVHFDFTPGFPFTGHGTPREDLEALAKSIQDKTMPPLRYRLLHPSLELSHQERHAVLQWIATSEQILGP